MTISPASDTTLGELSSVLQASGPGHEVVLMVLDWLTKQGASEETT
jgi:hypothetical protein